MMTEKPSNVHNRTERILGNHCTAKGNLLCRFDLFIRWPEAANRKLNPFTERGDKWGIIEPDKMLCSLLKYFVKDHHRWLIAQLRDNTKPLNDPERIVLQWHKGVLVENRLKNYAPMLENFPVPDWLK